MILHDLIIRITAQHLRGDNCTLASLLLVNVRFYRIRDIFIGQVRLYLTGSHFAYRTRPYGWNKVFSMFLTEYHWPRTMKSEIKLLGNLRSLSLINIYNTTDLTPLKHLYSLHIEYCDVVDVSPLSRLHDLYIGHCNRITDVSSLTEIYSLEICYCHGITNYSMLKNKHLVIITGR